MPRGPRPCSTAPAHMAVAAAAGSGMGAAGNGLRSSGRLAVRTARRHQDGSPSQDVEVVAHVLRRATSFGTWTVLDDFGP